MFYTFIAVAAILFIAHVALLLMAFPGSELERRRYFYSHLTLWLTGAVVFAMAVLYSGKGQSGFLDYFDTPFKKAMILAFTIALSFTAHTIVRLLVVPLLRKSHS